MQIFSPFLMAIHKTALFLCCKTYKQTQTKRPSHKKAAFLRITKLNFRYYERGKKFAPHHQKEFGMERKSNVRSV